MSVSEDPTSGAAAVPGDDPTQAAGAGPDEDPTRGAGVGTPPSGCSPKRPTISYDSTL